MHMRDVAPTEDGARPVTGARFTGTTGSYCRMMIRGALLQAVTLGIYRFWLATEMRRFLWANTEIDGDSLDYTGTAIELLLGFLIALAILVPIYVLFAIAGLELGLYSQLAGVAGFLALTAFGQYAFFRARRYRLSRTVYRGIRFHQDGSAWAYAARSILWGILVILTLGLAYPFAQASLERYKLRHTLYGDLRASFAQNGTRLFLRGLPMWLILVGPLMATLVFAASAVDWAQVAAEISRRGPLNIGPIMNANKPLTMAVGAVSIAAGYMMFAAFILYPVFQAVVLKWWLSGLRFGAIAVSTSLRKRQVYGAYLRFLLLVIAFALVVAAIVALAGLLLKNSAPLPVAAATSQIGLGIAAIVSYIAVMMAAWVLYQVMVKLALWRMTVGSVSLAGFAAIADVKPQGEASSAVGEGLADALGAGGL
jgi:uncharacterized membrane protein YjgN (DUF898 family)